MNTPSPTTIAALGAQLIDAGFDTDAAMALADEAEAEYARLAASRTAAA